MTAQVDVKDLNLEMLVEVHHLGGIVNSPISHLADMHKAILMHADIDEGTEGGDIGHDARQHHAGLHILDTGDILVELKHFELGPWV